MFEHISTFLCSGFTGSFEMAYEARALAEELRKTEVCGWGGNCKGICCSLKLLKICKCGVVYIWVLSKWSYRIFSGELGIFQRWPSAFIFSIDMNASVSFQGPYHYLESNI